MHNSDSQLVERDREFGEVEAMLAAAAAGAGRMVVVSGGAGTGKSALLRAALAPARDSGFTVLAARGIPSERELPFGLVNRLFAPTLPEPADAAAAFTGHPSDAGLAAELQRFQGALTRLAARSPVLVAVDDLQYLDRESLRWLSALPQRIDQAPVAVMLTVCPGEPCADPAALDELLAVSAVEVHPAELSALAAGTVVERALTAAPDEPFVAAVMRETGGNPLSVAELTSALRDHAVAPTADSAGLLGDIAVPRLAAWLRARLRRMSPYALDLARAVAVLGADADFARVGLLCEVGPAQVMDTVTALDRSGLIEVTDGSLAFAQPLIRNAVLQDVPLADLYALHTRAAGALRATGAPDNRVAEQLVATPLPTGPWAGEVLRAAAAAALDRGAPDQAAAYLARALREPLPDATRTELLAELGHVEGYLDLEAAIEHLAAACAGPPAEGAGQLEGQRAGRVGQPADAAWESRRPEEAEGQWAVRLEAGTRTAGRHGTGAHAAELAAADCHETDRHDAGAERGGLPQLGADDAVRARPAGEQFEDVRPAREQLGDTRPAREQFADTPLAREPRVPQQPLHERAPDQSLREPAPYDLAARDHAHLGGTAREPAAHVPAQHARTMGDGVRASVAHDQPAPEHAAHHRTRHADPSYVPAPSAQVPPGEALREPTGPGRPEQDRPTQERPGHDRPGHDGPGHDRPAQALPPATPTAPAPTAPHPTANTPRPRESRPPALRESALRELADHLTTTGRPHEADRLLDANPEPVPGERALWAADLRCDAEAPAGAATGPLPRLPRPQRSGGVDEIRHLSLLATRTARAGRSRSKAAALAEQALAAAPFTPESLRPTLRAVLVLAQAGRAEEAYERCEALLAEVNRWGHRPGLAAVRSLRGAVAHRLGRMPAAAEDARAAMELLEGCGVPRYEGAALGLLARLVHVHVDLGAYDEAAALVAEVRTDTARTWAGTALLLARGRLRVAAGQHADGLRDLLTAGGRLPAWKADNPAVAPWRSGAAWALLALGEPAEARRYAAEEVEQARRWGTPGPLSAALRALGAVAGGTEGLALLEKSVQVAERSEDRLGLARSLAAHGAALARANRRVPARRSLRSAIAVAEECGCPDLAGRARVEMYTAGGRPPKAADPVGVASLTAAELRTATLAAEGRTNRELAEVLAVGLRTVEIHLTNAYRKLGIDGRDRLPDALLGHPSADAGSL